MARQIIRLTASPLSKRCYLQLNATRLKSRICTVIYPLLSHLSVTVRPVSLGTWKHLSFGLHCLFSRAHRFILPFPGGEACIILFIALSLTNYKGANLTHEYPIIIVLHGITLMSYYDPLSPGAKIERTKG